MSRDTANRVSLIVAILVGVGALLSGGISFALTLAGMSSFPRYLILQDPIAWAIGPHMHPLRLLAMLLALVVLVAATWLFVRLVARAAAPGKGAAVFFGTWGAVIIAGWLAGIVRTPMQIVAYRIPDSQPEFLFSQISSLSTTGVLWALTWGWIVALVAALIFTARSVAQPVGDPYGGVPGGPAPGGPTPVAPYTGPGA